MEAATNYPLNLDKTLLLKAQQNPDAATVFSIVKKIVSQFKTLIENNGIWKSLWSEGKRLPESYSQRLFFTVAYAYCKANNIDVTPEADSGNGPVDFKFSNGFDSRVLVEVKLTSNNNVVKGFTNQLEAYKRAEEAIYAIYLLIDVGRAGKKVETLFSVRNQILADQPKGLVSEIELIDANERPSASKL